MAATNMDHEVSTCVVVILTSKALTPCPSRTSTTPYVKYLPHIEEQIIALYSKLLRRFVKSNGQLNLHAIATSFNV